MNQVFCSSDRNGRVFAYCVIHNAVNCCQFCLVSLPSGFPPESHKLFFFTNYGAGIRRQGILEPSIASTNCRLLSNPRAEISVSVCVSQFTGNLTFCGFRLACLTWGPKRVCAAWPLSLAFTTYNSSFPRLFSTRMKLLSTQQRRSN